MSAQIFSVSLHLVWVLVGEMLIIICTVVILPISWIWSLGMPGSQKLGVSGICSLALVTIAFETVRSVKLYQEDAHLTNLYGYLELLVAVIISMLPAYRFLISSTKKNLEYRRLLRSRFTLRSHHSNHSAHSMDNYNQASGASGSRSTAAAAASGEAPPLPTAIKADKAQGAPQQGHESV